MATPTRRPGSRPRRRPPARRPPADAASVVVLPAFLVLSLLLALLCGVPARVAAWVAVFYGAASLACLALYAIDKARAVRGGRRIRERTLLVAGLVGGWPGAIVGQQWLRHKRAKASFRRWSWLAVAVNVAAFVGAALLWPRLAAAFG